ncbi:MAG TPA: FdrA family protein, partial [Nocardioidaceae bacterium]|nr:FdrA family protein [Nocardioidaceae bacterium]
MIHVEVRPGAYADSVALLQVSRDVAALDGVHRAQVAMATPLNVEVLAGMGFEVPPATPNDLVIALDADDIDAALAAVTAALGSRRSLAEDRAVAARTTRSALREGGDLVLVSVPGASATVEAMDALEAGCDVMIFSDNVPVAEEVALKQYAATRGLLVMGPDCGTAVVGGVGLGFANVVGPGPVGLVAASGTGCQQLLCLLDAAGAGVSQALGVGGRDLSSEVGGLATREALRRLDGDPSIKRIVLVSKPPAPEVADDLRAFAATLTTPVTFALLGPGEPDLTAAAESVLRELDRGIPAWPARGQATPARAGLLRGLFVGGTLCTEATLIAAQSLPSNAFSMIDFGDDEYTQGRAHPMIDPTLRLVHLSEALANEATGAVLLDVVLGHGAEPDPAAALAPLISDATVPVLVACVGTAADPQG